MESYRIRITSCISYGSQAGCSFFYYGSWSNFWFYFTFTWENFYDSWLIFVLLILFKHFVKVHQIKLRHWNWNRISFVLLLFYNSDWVTSEVSMISHSSDQFLLDILQPIIRLLVYKPSPLPLNTHSFIHSRTELVEIVGGLTHL